MSGEGFWRDRSTLVTGATGLVGGWLVRRLLDLGADVTCLVRDWVPRSEFSASNAVERANVVRGDLRDGRLLERTLVEYEVKTVLHLGAQTIVGTALRDPRSTLEVNVAGTWELLDACRRSKSPAQVVLASSDKAYGDNGTEPYDETTPLRGTAPYDVSKSCADLVAQMFATTYGTPVVITRCGNFFGGGDLNWNRIVPGTIRSALRGERPVIRSDGSFVRDYVYVEDGVNAYLALAERFAADPKLAGRAYNFSYEQPLDVLSIARRVLGRMGSTLELDVRGTATSEIPYQALQSKRAREELGWKPLYSLDEGLDATIAWYRRYFEEGDVERRAGARR